MTTPKQNSAHFPAWKVLGFAALLLCLSAPAFSQNTKGDRPVNNQRKVRETNGKSIRKKEKGKGKTKDISGRRLRTKGKSSANQANAEYPQTSPYYRKRSGKDRASQPRGRTFSNSPRENRTQAWTGDISGHRIRRIKPSKAAEARNNIYPQFGGYGSTPISKPRKPDSHRAYRKTATGKRIPNRKPQQRQRAWKGNIGGGPIGTRSRSGATENVYPQNNPFSSSFRKSVKNRDDKPYKVSGIAARSRSGLSSGKRRSGYPGSASGSFIKGGRKNVYWGKYSKGERAITRDLSGNPVRMRNFRSASAGLAGRDSLRHFGKKPGGDRQFRGKGRKFSIIPSIQRAWKGDLTGRNLRNPKARKNGEVAGQMVLPKNLSNTKKRGERAGRYLPGGGYSTRSNRKSDNRPLPARGPGAGASGMEKRLLKTKGIRPLSGGGSVNRKGWNNNGQPVGVNRGGAGAARGALFQGNIKGSRPIKGGGSVSGNLWNNKQSAIGVRSPGAGSIRGGRYSGNIHGGFKNYYDQGEEYTGNIKFRGRPTKGGGSASGKLWNNQQSAIAARIGGDGTQRAGRFSGNLKSGRPLKGGGSVSGKLWNNRQAPVGVRTPTSAAAKAGLFSGNIKAGRNLKGGGSVSGKLWNNRQSPVGVRIPTSAAAKAGLFSGNIKAGRKLKGGGSVSGKLWNNGQTPVGVRTPTSAAAKAGLFSGNIKAGRMLKGGGSVSGKLWNNGQSPIGVRTPGSGSMRAGKFSGNIPQGYKNASMRDQGEEYTGNIRLRGRPVKGGGTTSGKLWNNGESPIGVRSPGSGSIRAGRYSGNIPQGYRNFTMRDQGEEYTGNIKIKGKPLKGGGSVSGKLWNNEESPIEVRIPKGEKAGAVGYAGKKKLRNGYTQSPYAKEESIKKRRPHETTYLVDGLQVKVKQGKYTKRPNAAEDAMLGIGPEKATRDASKYGGDVKIVRNYKHNPSSADDALKTIAPTKSSLKASEYASSMKMYWRYKHAPLSSEAALKVRAPGKAYARLGDYQGNIRMHKYNDSRLHPDAQFAHGYKNNVKNERTILMDVKLFWARVFKKSDTQPENLKENVRKPRYDRGEKGLWAGDPSYTNSKKQEK